MSEFVDSSSRICKAELCELEGLHLFHELTPFHIRCKLCSAPAGSLCDREFERERGHTICGSYHHARILALRDIDRKPCKRVRDPWMIPSGEALDESILRCASDRMPRLVTQILDVVQNDYGTIADNEQSAFRQLRRRIKRLVAAGEIVRVDLGKQLYAYVVPDARLANDVDEIRSVIMENFERSPLAG
ncbi:MAG: hypothetical protein ACREMT_10955 [Vulcanimicrobiaceae bacterium]